MTLKLSEVGLSEIRKAQGVLSYSSIAFERERLTLSLQALWCHQWHLLL
jgi:hypothetical protein